MIWSWLLALSTKAKLWAIGGLVVLLGVAYAVLVFRSTYRAKQSAELQQRRGAARLAESVKRVRDRLSEQQAKERARIEAQLRVNDRSQFEEPW